MVRFAFLQCLSQIPHAWPDACHTTGGKRMALPRSFFQDGDSLISRLGFCSTWLHDRSIFVCLVRPNAGQELDMNEWQWRTAANHRLSLFDLVYRIVDYEDLGFSYQRSVSSYLWKCRPENGLCVFQQCSASSACRPGSETWLNGKTIPVVEKDEWFFFSVSSISVSSARLNLFFASRKISLISNARLNLEQGSDGEGRVFAGRCLPFFHFSPGFTVDALVTFGCALRRPTAYSCLLCSRCGGVANLPTLAWTHIRCDLVYLDKQWRRKVFSSKGWDGSRVRWGWLC